MKKIYFLLVVLMTTVSAWTQKTWDGPPTGGSWNEPTNWLPAGVPANGDTILINGGITGTITDVAASGDVMLRGLRVEGGSNVVFINAFNNRTIIVDDEFGSEDFYVEAGSTLTLGGGSTGVDIELRDNYWTEALIAGTLVVSSGRTYLSDNHNTIGQKATRVTGIIENSGSVVGSEITLEFQNGGTYIHARNGGAIPTATWDDASDCIINGVVDAAPTGLSQSFGNFTWDCASQNTGIQNVFPPVINGNLVINQVGATTDNDIYVTFPQTVNLKGDFELHSGVCGVVGTFSFDTRNINIGGNFIMTGGKIRSFAAFSVFIVNFNFNGTTTQLFSKTGGSIETAGFGVAMNNFIVKNGSALNFTNSVLNGAANFTLENNAKIITAHASGLYSSGANGAVQVTGTRSYSNTADYEFNGASTGTFTTTGNRVRDLIINNSVSGQVLAGRNFTVDRMLTLIHGYLTTAAGQVTVSAAGSASSVNGAFVNGPLSKITNSQVVFTFPVGKVAGGLRTIGIKPVNNNNSTFVAEFFRAVPPTAPMTGGLTKISSCEYWNLARTSGAAPAAVTLSWTSASACNGGAYVTSLADLRVAHLRTGSWRNEGNTSVTGSPAAGFITSGNVASFSTFALGTISEANALPVVYGNVKAYEKNSGVQIEWSNLTEKDVASYSVERSANGSDFSAIAQQLPASNQNDQADYTAFDAAPQTGTNYYRIKAVETTGKIAYSKVLSVKLGATAQRLSLYPNPVQGNQVNISLSNLKRGQYDLRVINAAGQDVLKQRLNSPGSNLTQTINLPASIAPGVYNLVIAGGDIRESKMFIVQ